MRRGLHRDCDGRGRSKQLEDFGVEVGAVDALLERRCAAASGTGRHVGRLFDSGQHQLLLPPANWCPMFASRTTQCAVCVLCVSVCVLCVSVCVCVFAVCRVLCYACGVCVCTRLCVCCVCVYVYTVCVCVCVCRVC